MSVSDQALILALRAKVEQVERLEKSNKELRTLYRPKFIVQKNFIGAPSSLLLSDPDGFGILKWKYFFVGRLFLDLDSDNAHFCSLGNSRETIRFNNLAQLNAVRIYKLGGKASSSRIVDVAHARTLCKDLCAILRDTLLSHGTDETTIFTFEQKTLEMLQ